MSNGAATRIRRSREKILAAAEDIFLRLGFLGSNMDMIAERAGVSKQTVYAHFKSKEALFIEVVKAMTAGAANKIGKDVEEVFDGRLVEEYLLDVAIAHLAIVLTPRLMRLRRMVIGEVERFPELGRSLYLNGPIRSIKQFTRALEHYASIGQIETAEPEAAATHFNWLVMGGPTSAAMLLGDEGIPGKAKLRAHAQEAVRIFLCAYATDDRLKAHDY
ncbi:TetR/AcrR family transcriptional regulator [Pseudaminobacter soli (ex Li et al. 2025)]|uniref:TetR family transcriptional regulator n=1 Tax=Pseudaminobacter soli (ex Li et al. 2025) TaxID=1295366 RepID=A0A2P7RVX6_9HYPH|nr:TetR/AcrR family transcriptional regulator [Mesorhizobium soli]PSJ54356.1 TetR family transcriptional regulator [Mesorhizobium soli]